MSPRSVADIEKIWSNVEGIKKLSDRVIPIGPYGIGLDGLLSFVPGVGLIYTVGAAGWLLRQAIRAKASRKTLGMMAMWLGLDTVSTLTGEVFFLPADVIDFLFPGHLLAARVLQKDIAETHWVEAREADARASGAHAEHEAKLKADPKLKRIVYLHD